MEFNKLGVCEGADDVTLRIKYATAHLKMSDGTDRRVLATQRRRRRRLEIISFHPIDGKILSRINGADIFLSNEFHTRWLFLDFKHVC